MKPKFEYLGVVLALVVVGILSLKHHERYYTEGYGMRCGYVSSDNFQCGWIK